MLQLLCIRWCQCSIDMSDKVHWVLVIRAGTTWSACLGLGGPILVCSSLNPSEAYKKKHHTMLHQKLLLCCCPLHGSVCGFDPGNLVGQLNTTYLPDSLNVVQLD